MILIQSFLLSSLCAALLFFSHAHATGVSTAANGKNFGVLHIDRSAYSIHEGVCAGRWHAFACRTGYGTMEVTDREAKAFLIATPALSNDEVFTLNCKIEIEKSVSGEVPTKEDIVRKYTIDLGRREYCSYLEEEVLNCGIVTVESETSISIYSVEEQRQDFARRTGRYSADREDGTTSHRERGICTRTETLPLVKRLF